MDKISLETAGISLGLGSYESPLMTVVGMTAEGVLCQSGSFEEWEEDELPWDEVYDENVEVDENYIKDNEEQK